MQLLFFYLNNLCAICHKDPSPLRVYKHTHIQRILCLFAVRYLDLFKLDADLDPYVHTYYTFEQVEQMTRHFFSSVTNYLTNDFT